MVGHVLAHGAPTWLSYVSALGPAFALFLLPALRWAVRSGIDNKLDPVKNEVTVLRQELKDHMQVEESTAVQRTEQLRNVGVRVDSLTQTVGTMDSRLATMDARLETIERRSHDRRYEDDGGQR